MTLTIWKAPSRWHYSWVLWTLKIWIDSKNLETSLSRVPTNGIYKAYVCWLGRFVSETDSCRPIVFCWCFKILRWSSIWWKFRAFIVRSWLQTHYTHLWNSILYKEYAKNSTYTRILPSFASIDAFFNIILIPSRDLYLFECASASLSISDRTSSAFWQFCWLCNSQQWSRCSAGHGDYFVFHFLIWAWFCLKLS